MTSPTTRITDAQNLAILLGELVELLPAAPHDRLTEVTITDPDPEAKGNRYSVWLGRDALQAVINGVSNEYQDAGEAIGAHPDVYDPEGDEEDDHMTRQDDAAQDPDYREAAQQDHESAVAEHDLQQAFEHYNGPLGWYEWAAQQRAKWGV